MTTTLDGPSSLFPREHWAISDGRTHGQDYMGNGWRNATKPKSLKRHNRGHDFLQLQLAAEDCLAVLDGTMLPATKGAHV